MEQIFVSWLFLVSTIIVGTAVSTMIVGTNVCFVVVLFELGLLLVMVVGLRRWPDHFIPRADYKGATKSLLSSGQVTELIMSMLEAIDPATHDAEVEDHQPDEN